MLADEANLLKQKKREEQIKKWRERESDTTTTTPLLSGGGNYQQDQQIIKKSSSKVKFPQSCVFLAACTANDLDEVRYYLKNGVNINSINNDGLTALHQVSCIFMLIYLYQSLKFLFKRPVSTTTPQWLNF